MLVTLHFGVGWVGLVGKYHWGVVEVEGLGVLTDKYERYVSYSLHFSLFLHFSGIQGMLWKSEKLQLGRWADRQGSGTSKGSNTSKRSIVAHAVVKAAQQAQAIGVKERSQLATEIRRLQGGGC